MIVKRSCPICEASCGLRIEVDRQARRVLKLAGDPDDPRSRGYICPKAFASQGIYEDSERLRTPQRRTRAGWQDVSWDDAYDEVAERLLGIRNQHGPMALAYYIGNPIGHDVGSQFYLPHLLQGFQPGCRFEGSQVSLRRSVVKKQMVLYHPFRLRRTLCLWGSRAWIVRGVFYHWLR